MNDLHRKCWIRSFFPGPDPFQPREGAAFPSETGRIWGERGGGAVTVGAFVRRVGALVGRGPPVRRLRSLRLGCAEPPPFTQGRLLVGDPTPRSCAQGGRPLHAANERKKAPPLGEPKSLAEFRRPQTAKEGPIVFCVALPRKKLFSAGKCARRARAAAASPRAESPAKRVSAPSLHIACAQIPISPGPVWTTRAGEICPV